MAVWHAADLANGRMDAQAGFVLAAPHAGDGAEISAFTLPGGKGLRVLCVGPYSTIPDAWRALYEAAGARGLTPGLGWEEYVDDPTEVPAATLRTVLTLHVG